MTSAPYRRVVITGGAGFIGCHLCEWFLTNGAEVVCVDSLITGRSSNIHHLLNQGAFFFVQADITTGLFVEGPVEAVLHFASPASPIDYLRLPIQTLKVGALGTHNALGLAKVKGGSFPAGFNLRGVRRPASASTGRGTTGGT